MKSLGIYSIIKIHKRGTEKYSNIKISNEEEKIMIISHKLTAEVRMEEYKQVAYNYSILTEKKSSKNVKRPFLNKLISALSL